MTPRLRALLPVLSLPLFLAACGTESSDLPAGLGPLAPVTDVALPAECASATGLGSLVIGPARGVIASPSYTERQALGCTPHTLAQVWQAMKGQAGVNVSFWPEHTETDCEAWFLTDPGYPATFVTKEIPHGGIERFYTFEVTWRAGFEGSESAPSAVKVLYGKTSGTVEVPKILGSIRFVELDGHPGWSRIEMVRQINTGGHSDEPAKLNNWLQSYFDGLQTQLATGSLAPQYCTMQ